jgi:hypothetical protein
MLRQVLPREHAFVHHERVSPAFEHSCGDLTDKAANPASLQAVFRVLVGMHGLAFLLQVALLLIASRSKNKGKTD